MSLSTTPSSARTDAAPGAVPGSAPGTGPRHAPDPSRLVRLGGLATTAGAVAWAAGLLATADVDPATDAYPLAYKAATLLFQLGLVALVAVQLRTRATGTGRLARGCLHAEHVLLGLAIGSSVQWLVAPGLTDEPFFVALDLCWPLSMLGMAAIGVRIAVAGRWRGAARVWPALAETWALVMFPVAAVAGATTESLVGAGHLVLGYGVLGLVLATRPELTRR
ncbi:hypothetical protein [Geodermatophilus sp. FMUSA9-8]|uniref:hypothetical protein n=1 Tax=Geodermatophilus sp. FMUSA9-8 TaxID=3120155 RepID=UPI00300ABBE4